MLCWSKSLHVCSLYVGERNPFYGQILFPELLGQNLSSDHGYVLVSSYFLHYFSVIARWFFFLNGGFSPNRRTGGFELDHAGPGWTATLQPVSHAWSGKTQSLVPQEPGLWFLASCCLLNTAPNNFNTFWEVLDDHITICGCSAPMQGSHKGSIYIPCN